MDAGLPRSSRPCTGSSTEPQPWSRPLVTITIRVTPVSSRERVRKRQPSPSSARYAANEGFPAAGCGSAAGTPRRKTPTSRAEVVNEAASSSSTVSAPKNAISTPAVAAPIIRAPRETAS